MFFLLRPSVPILFFPFSFFFLSSNSRFWVNERKNLSDQDHCRHSMIHFFIRRPRLLLFIFWRLLDERQKKESEKKSFFFSSFIFFFFFFFGCLRNLPQKPAQRRRRHCQKMICRCCAAQRSSLWKVITAVLKPFFNNFPRFSPWFSFMNLLRLFPTKQSSNNTTIRWFLSPTKKEEFWVD